MTKIKQHAYLFDATRCIDCRACMIACTVENNVPANDSYIWVAGQGVMGSYPNLKRASMPYHCMHCLEPDCVSACPVGAWNKREDGPVLYDEDKCIGCRYCMIACPFSVPKYEWEKIIFPWVRKCTFCADRMAGELTPACIKVCPTKTMFYGDYDEVVAEAQKRMKDSPGKYIDHIYGEKEAGYA